MPIPEHRLASNMDLKKSMMMGLDEAHVALKEAYSDLSNEQFWAFPFEGRSNAATYVMHVLQQLDDFNGNLQLKRGIPGPVRDWHFMEWEERFHISRLTEDQMPKPDDKFPPVAEVLAIHDQLHHIVLGNMEALNEDEFVCSGVGRRTRLCDIFFRHIYHTQAHVRQIWFMRGLMGVTRKFPEQNFA